MSETNLPLEGMRVIDAADGIGEFAGRIMAELGAEVLRLEPPGGAPSRSLPPFAGDGTGLYFEYRNVNKRSITVDISTDAGREDLRALLAGADIFIESNRPGELTDLGLDPSELVANLPHLVIASITPYGQTGPYSGFEASGVSRRWPNRK
jgi:crotonobetainyl-CoA:carnitine CoA-transferase CaiB-like acyl-CoA transferase